MRLVDLISPQSAREFLDSTYGKKWHHYRGAKDRFQKLADWDMVNSLLTTQRISFPRLRVAKQGKLIPVENYTEQVETISNLSYQRVVRDGLLRELREGATLSIDRIDRAHMPLRELAVALEAELKVLVFVNVYASWSSLPGFDLHWDDHDIFVIQLSGKKHWQIFEPTRNWPLYHDISESPTPTSAPVAEFEMNPGEVLYLPYGWWHSVNALDEPSLHLTIGVEPDKGVDLLSWLLDQAKHHEIFRKRIPRLADEEEKVSYLRAVRSKWNDLIGSDDVLQRFLTYADGMNPARPLFELPNILDENSDLSILEQQKAHIKLLAPRAAVSLEGDGFILTALGRRWAFPAAAKPLVDVVTSPGGATVAEAIAANANVSKEQSARVLTMLARAGVIAIR